MKSHGADSHDFALFSVPVVFQLKVFPNIRISPDLMCGLRVSVNVAPEQEKNLITIPKHEFYFQISAVFIKTKT